MYLTELCRRMLNENLHDFVLEHRDKLEWMARIIPEFVRTGEDEHVTGITMKKILAYDKRYGRTPSPKALMEFVEADLDEGYPLDDAGHSALSDDLSDIGKLSDADPFFKAIMGRDLYVVADQAFQRIRGSVVSSFALRFSEISQGKRPYEPQKGVELYGPEAAFAYLNERMRTCDFQPIRRPVAGPLHLHAARVGDYLARISGGTGSDSHMPLGYWHIDDRVTVDKKDCGFVGIIGEAKQGKTTLVNSIVYNWACAGKNVLYVSLEHGFENLGARLAIMHSGQAAREHGDAYRIPSLESFKARRATDLDVAAAQRIMNGIKHRLFFPGVLDIQPIRSWDGIKSHLLSNDCKYHYDALAVDYMRRLDLPARPGERDAAMAAIIHDAQSLSRTFQGRGLVILTPIEVNREGSKEARGGEAEKETDRRWTINAIRQDTAFQYSLDLCLGVWSDDDMRENGQIEVEGVFCREGKVPLRHLLYVNRRTERIVYLPSEEHEEAPVQGWARNWPKGESLAEELPAYDGAGA
jgi:hypothetical protein